MARPREARGDTGWVSPAAGLCAAGGPRSRSSSLERPTRSECSVTGPSSCRAGRARHADGARHGHGARHADGARCEHGAPSYRGARYALAGTTGGNRRDARRVSPRLRYARCPIDHRDLARRRRRHLGEYVFGAAIPAPLIRSVPDPGDRRRLRSGLVRRLDQRRVEYRRPGTASPPRLLDDRPAACGRAVDDRKRFHEVSSTFNPREA